MTENVPKLATPLVVGRKKDGRRVYSAQGKREFVRMCLRDGVSVARIALEHGVNANLLRKWIDADSARSGAAPPAAATGVALLPVELERPTAVSVKPPAPPEATGWIEIVRCGDTVRLYGPIDAGQLGTVLGCLARHP